ncbi:MAG: VOC family protein [Actinobacteria bacterium]|nr:VOC family protein [Actinomycetota bacterium]
MAAAATTLGRLGGAVVSVPDPDASAGFLETALGFEIRPLDGGLQVVCAGDYGESGQAALELRPGPETGLVELVFEVGAGYDLGALALRARAAGLAPEAAGEEVAFADATGIGLRCVRAAARAVAMPAADGLRPRRLGHVNLKAADPGAAARGWEEVMGLMLSEQIGEALYFLRIAREHHNVGLRPGPRGELHHLGFEVAGWHVYEPILDRLAALGHRVEYGPGRHTPGNNIFTYLLEPASGLRLELFADMGRIAAGAEHEPKRWEAGDRMTQTLNRWGPLPPESFLA